MKMKLRTMKDGAEEVPNSVLSSFDLIESWTSWKKNEIMTMNK